MEEWLKSEGAGAKPEEIKKYANSLVDSLVGSVGRATDELLGNDPKDPLGGVRDALKT